MACMFNQCIYKLADNPQQLNVLISAAGFWMDGLVNFPIDIVWKGEENKKTEKIFFSFLFFFFFFFFFLFFFFTFHLAHGY